MSSLTTEADSLRIGSIGKAFHRNMMGIFDLSLILYVNEHPASLKSGELGQLLKRLYWPVHLK
eukprot:1147537-Pelagomonas_calceolata.AAC.4